MLVTLRPRNPHSRSPLRLVAAAVLAVFAVFAAGCTAATASPGDTVGRDRYEYSADGVAWAGAETIPWDRTTIPVPGGMPNSTTFHLRISGHSPLTAEVYLGRWSVDRGSAWFRVDVDGAAGEKVTLPRVGTTRPGVLMGEFLINPGGSVVLTLHVGVAFGEVEQAARIAPDWGIVLRENAPGGGPGPIGSGSLGPSLSFGSLGGPPVTGR